MFARIMYVCADYVCLCGCVCAGACYCQLMDCLFPGSIDLSNVKFQALQQEDYIYNLNLLQESFKKTGIDKVRKFQLIHLRCLL